VPRTLAINFFRPNRPQAGNLLARGRVVNTSTFFAFTEVEIEDPEGRHIAHAAGQSAFRAIEPPPPPPPSRLLPVEEPIYATPDPHLRSVPRQPTPPEEWQRHGGLAIMRGHLDGTYGMPFADLYGVRFLEVDEGRVITALPASEWFGRFSRSVAPGVLAALAGTTAWSAGLSLLQPGDSLIGLDQISRFHRDVPLDGRVLRAEARVLVRDRDLWTAETGVYDADGALVASQSVTGSFIEWARRRRRPQVETRRILATLLFVDIVGSTDLANRLGDMQWRQLLDEHRTAVRREVVRCEGIEIDTAGDGFFVRLESPARAIECARAVRAAVKRLGVEVRAGIHIGECETHGRDLSGIAVHIAARVQGAAAPGEILVSSTVRDLAAGSAHRFEDPGGTHPERRPRHVAAVRTRGVRSVDPCIVAMQGGGALASIDNRPSNTQWSGPLARLRSPRPLTAAVRRMKQSFPRRPNRAEVERYRLRAKYTVVGWRSWDERFRSYNSARGACDDEAYRYAADG
jgi:class 3 adenylate cyclase